MNFIMPLNVFGHNFRNSDIARTPQQLIASFFVAEGVGG
jgi:hypothetical protein